MVEEGDLDDRLEDKATNEVVDDVKKVAMEGVDKEKKQVAMKVVSTNCLDDLIDDVCTCIHLYTVPTVFCTEAPWSCLNLFYKHKIPSNKTSTNSSNDGWKLLASIVLALATTQARKMDQICNMRILSFFTPASTDMVHASHQNTSKHVHLAAVV